jgi:hypothetical protein
MEETAVSRHIVCLTFDFDVMTGFIARGMTTPTPISRGSESYIFQIRLAQERDPGNFVPGVVYHVSRRVRADRGRRS